MSAVANIPLTGTRIIVEFRDGEVLVNGKIQPSLSNTHKPILVQNVLKWASHVVFENGATGTIQIEATADNRIGFNIEEGPGKGDPEDNNWVILLSTALDAIHNQAEPIFRLARSFLVSGSFPNADSVIRVTYLAYGVQH